MSNIEPEIKAIDDCVKALEPLERLQQNRAMRYLWDRFGPRTMFGAVQSPPDVLFSSTDIVGQEIESE